MSIQFWCQCALLAFTVFNFTDSVRSIAKSKVSDMDEKLGYLFLGTATALLIMYGAGVFPSFQ